MHMNAETKSFYIHFKPLLLPQARIYSLHWQMGFESLLGSYALYFSVPYFSYSKTWAPVFWNSSEKVIFFFAKFYIFKRKASDKKVCIIEIKLFLNHTHLYHLLMQ